jgi:hypothetical protein
MSFLKQDSGARSVFTVIRHEGGWAVEHDGGVYDASASKDEARAAANRRARACMDAGRMCQVNVAGEAGFFSPRGRREA